MPMRATHYAGARSAGKYAISVRMSENNRQENNGQENNGQAGARDDRRRVEDEAFMRQALAEAASGDLPFGAVIVSNGAIVARGHNAGVRLNDPTAHGEMMALRDFISRHPADRLASATVYTTGEPCPMCMSALIWCGVERVVYAASITELSTRVGQIMTPSASLLAAASFSCMEITGGVLAGEALELFASLNDAPK